MTKNFYGPIKLVNKLLNCILISYYGWGNARIVMLQFLGIVEWWSWWLSTALIVSKRCKLAFEFAISWLQTYNQRRATKRVSSSAAAMYASQKIRQKTEYWKKSPLKIFFLLNFPLFSGSIFHFSGADFSKNSWYTVISK